MSGLRCRIRGWWWTVTMALFWESLVNPPLVIASGHIWDHPGTEKCVDCGASGE